MPNERKQLVRQEIKILAKKTVTLKRRLSYVGGSAVTAAAIYTPVPLDVVLKWHGDQRLDFKKFLNGGPQETRPTNFRYMFILKYGTPEDDGAVQMTKAYNPRVCHAKFHYWFTDI